MPTRILIIGSEGQLGSELTAALIQRHGADHVTTADLRSRHANRPEAFITLDATDVAEVDAAIATHAPQHVYHLAAVLSAAGEKDPARAWHINMASLLAVFDACVKHKVERVYWPSSIATFGPNTPAQNTPQHPYMDPNTVYGISKMAGELWARYYFEKHQLDVRSLRYPGLISYKTPPGGGTTDYAVDIFYHAVEHKPYTCFLKEGSTLPMMYMEDAVRATIEIMEAAPERIRERTSYNLAAVSFAPEEVAAAIQKRIPGFQVVYEPDSRQAIADSWPQSIDDAAARADWGWQPRFGLNEMVDAMLEGLQHIQGK